MEVYIPHITSAQRAHGRQEQQGCDLSSHRGRLSSHGGEKGGGRRRGGERRPRARSGPGGGGRLRPYRKLNRKVPPYATTSVGFPTAGGVSATGTRCSVSPIELQHMRMGLRRSIANLLTPQ